ncbi:MAG: RNA polymerase sigma factor SigZ [Bacteroidota bacterium]
MNATVETVYNDFHAKLRSFTLGQVSDPDVAEDILQDVYLRIHSHIQDLRDTDRLESWVFQVTRNAIADHFRRLHPHTELPDSLPAPVVEEPDTASELAASISDMVRCLPPKYRQALQLTDLEGLSQAELAQRLSISVSGAKSRVQRAREKLKEAFLDCCHFEFDRYGRVIDAQPNCPECAGEHRPKECEADPPEDD